MWIDRKETKTTRFHERDIKLERVILHGIGARENLKREWDMKRERERGREGGGGGGA